MNLSTQQQEILAEMGLSPLWVLRNKTPVPPASPTFSPAASAEQLSDQSDQIQAAPIIPALRPAPALVSATASTDAAPKIAGGDSISPIADLSWDQLETGVAACRACGLCAQRQQAVLGVGDRSASWLFIGEGPGAEEDAQGEPFVGPSGQLLDAMLAAMGLSRQEDVYIANAVKCRPPSNRAPEVGEINACRPYLERQIALIQPKVIVLLGRAAARAVLRKDDTLSDMRGQTFEYRAGERSIPLVVTYHPAYLLRTLPDKSKSWEDLCRARALMREVRQAAAGALANPLQPT